MVAAPSKGVIGLKVVPITTSSVEVHWNMIDEIYWSGDYETGGYRVVYQPVSDFPTPLQATPKKDVVGIQVYNTSHMRDIMRIIYNIISKVLFTRLYIIFNTNSHYYATSINNICQ